MSLERTPKGTGIQSQTEQLNYRRARRSEIIGLSLATLMLVTGIWLLVRAKSERPLPFARFTAGLESMIDLA